MQKFIYVIAAVVAAGIAYVIATAPNQRTSPDAEQSTTVTAADAGASTVPATAGTAVRLESGSITLAVPEMHCEFSCFPRVKKTLEASELIKEVVLGPQKEKGTVDNRQVIVHFESGFDLNDAIARLNKEGFTDSTSVK